jgi:hypothetical protein
MKLADVTQWVRAMAPVPPESWARFIDKDQMPGFGWHLADEVVNVTLRSAYPSEVIMSRSDGSLDPAIWKGGVPCVRWHANPHTGKCFPPDELGSVARYCWGGDFIVWYRVTYRETV